MSEKPPAFTVTDRRKFTLEGEPRDEHETPQSEAEQEKSGPRLVTPPAREEAPAPAPVAVAEPEEEPIPELTAEETAAQHAAYQQSSQQLDDMIRQANPGAASQLGAVTFDHVIQSIYLSAMMAMGAGTEPGQKPRVDIVGARQSIDMLGVLQEKTKGNLTEKEKLLLQNALFELRMMFVEITNAIAQSALHPQGGKK